ncbi:MAG TPA: glycosyltransferase family 2 protein [Acidimicrobiales bacterium]|nr:glycosyltransferase family 2 protein [Acidimicrobiales bacterium]
MTTGAIVVNHNAGDSLFACVTSLVTSGIESIVVVDNDSHDASLAPVQRAYPDVRVILSRKNLGYGSAVNLGRAELVDEHIFVCNPDLVIDREAPALLAEYLSHHHDTGVVGPRIFETNGQVYPSARSFPSITDAFGHALLSMFWPHNRFSRRYRFATIGATHAVSADWVSGACFLVCAEAFDAVGGFDERYFMYVEDLDLCWRLRQIGWRSAYLPAATVVHHGGISAGQHPYRMLVAHHVSAWRFARKSLTGARSVILPFVFVGVVGRLAVALIRQFGRR